MGKTESSQFCKKSTTPLFNCGLIFPSSLDDFQGKDLVIFIASDEGFLRKPCIVYDRFKV